MNPDDITLLNTTQQFEYEKFSREIDMCEDCLLYTSDAADE